jgi:hypothetical protein
MTDEGDRAMAKIIAALAPPLSATAARTLQR